MFSIRLQKFKEFHRGTGSVVVSSFSRITVAQYNVTNDHMSPSMRLMFNQCSYQGDHWVTILVTSHYWSLIGHYFFNGHLKSLFTTVFGAIISNIEGGARAEKTHFFSNFFKNCLKIIFSACLFKNMPASQKFWPEQGLFSALAELEKLICST